MNWHPTLHRAIPRRSSSLIGSLCNWQSQVVRPATRCLHNSTSGESAPSNILLSSCSASWETANRKLKAPPLAFAFDIVCESVSVWSEYFRELTRCAQDGVLVRG